MIQYNRYIYYTRGCVIVFFPSSFFHALLVTFGLDMVPVLKLTQTISQ